MTRNLHDSNDFLRSKFQFDVYFQQGGATCPSVAKPSVFCVKSFQACANAPQSIQELKKKICAVIDEIEPQMCENVIENFINDEIHQ